MYRHTHGSKHFHHPVVGPLTLNYESLTLPADPDQRLSVYTAEAGSSSEEALRLLVAWMRQPETSHGQHADHWTPPPVHEEGSAIAVASYEPGRGAARFRRGRRLAL